MKNIQQVAKVLKRHFSDFSHHNKRNPLDELIFILCSTTTTYPVYIRTYNALKKRYKTYAALNKASIKGIAKAIHEGGQSTQKAIAIKGIFKILI
jgi:endonuclease III